MDLTRFSMPAGMTHQPVRSMTARVGAFPMQGRRIWKARSWKPRRMEIVKLFTGPQIGTHRYFFDELRPRGPKGLCEFPMGTSQPSELLIPVFGRPLELKGEAETTGNCRYRRPPNLQPRMIWRRGYSDAVDYPAEAQTDTDGERVDFGVLFCRWSPRERAAPRHVDGCPVTCSEAVQALFVSCNFQLIVDDILD